MEDWWFEEYVVDPAEAVLATLAIGEDVRDLEVCSKLSTGIEGCFRSEVAAQYAGWPPDATTDGSSIDLCIRTGHRSLEAVGLMWIDFAGDMFPFHAVISSTTADTSASVVASIGQVDPRTGSPPRLGRGTLIVPVRDGEGRNPTAHLIVGRHEVPIVWTQVFEYPARPQSAGLR